MKRTPIDPEILRDRLSVAQGKQYWRCLDELADDPSFREMLQREFPERASEWSDGMSRRRFLTLLGASLALGGLAGCRPPLANILPYVHQPEELVLGKPLYYATAMTLGGFATGLLVESHEGRPTKIEGNPQHPASLGATSPLHQAAILGLYDPDRAQAVTFRGQPRLWEDLLQELRSRLHPARGRITGERLAVLSEAIGSPTLTWLRNRFLSAYPQARWFTYEPINADQAHAGSALAFGQPYHHYYQVDKADVIVSLDADFLGTGPAQLAYTRAFARRRRDGREKKAMNRLYVIETSLTVTGGNADNRLALPPRGIEDFARALASKLGIAGVQTGNLSSEASRWVDAIVDDLRTRDGKPRQAGTTLVMAGDAQPPVVHALAHAINDHLGNLGSTVRFTEPPAAQSTSSMGALSSLAGAIEAGEIDTLLILGGNPVYAAPADIALGTLLTRQLEKKPREQWLAVHLSPYFDETARVCHWHIPETHFLEQWSDAVAFDGTASIVQPLIAPLYAGRSAVELVAALTPTDEARTSFDTRTPHELVRAYWKTHQPASSAMPFETFWQTALHEGIIPGTRWATVQPALVANLAETLPPRPTDPGKGLALVFAPDPTLYDGRFANNGWLQEMPKPITLLTWDNALIMSPATAKERGVGSRTSRTTGGSHGQSVADVVQVKQGRRTLEVPVWVLPGHADDAVTLYLGHGRTHAGKVGSKTGFPAGVLRTSASPWILSGVTFEPTGRRYSLACTQGHHSMEGRDILRSGTLEEYRKDPHFATREDKATPVNAALRHAAHEVREDQEKAREGRRVPLKTTLYGNEHTYPGYRWGMAIDLSTCTGCGACVVACQSENNVPVVGKEEVTRGREMHWLRIDRYFASPRGAAEPGTDTLVHQQPMLCVHCEHAPCEVVCPVEATVHGDEGTNDMIYNRCVGTRYCLNNCPYKVRRFNFFAYSNTTTPSLKLLYNPDVTVRSRGVMEKCTFCIQRISYGRIEAAKELLDEQEWEQRTGRKKKPDESRRDRNGPDGGPRTDQGKEVAYIRDGEVVTACQAACPAEAIIFGDLNDKKSRVHELHESALRYDVLGELGTRPRVVYLAELRNPNPVLVRMKND